MAIISANLQFNRGGHDLLDFSSKQLNYSTALAWAQDPNSNAAVGQFIYLIEAETIDGVEYAKGPYVVDAIGENAILNHLSKTTAGESDLDETVTDLVSDVAGLKTAVAGKADSFTVGNGLSKENNVISVKVDSAEDNALTVGENGLKVVLPDSVDVPEYEISKLETAENGYSASYELLKDGVRAGALINIPKDMVVSAGSVITATAEDVTADSSLVEGQKYIKLVLANADNSVIYIPVQDLVDAYTAGDDYIVISVDNKISLNITAVSAKVLSDVKADSEIAGAIDAVADVESLKADVESISGDVDTLKTDVESISGDVDTLKTDMANVKAAIDPDAESGLAVDVKDIKEVLGDAESGLVKDITTLKTNVATLTTDLDSLTTKVDGLNATNVNIVNAIDDVADAGDSIEDVLGKLNTKITDVAENAGIKSIDAGDGISIDDTTANQPVVSIKLDSSVSSEVASLGENGLKVEDMRSKWVKF